MLSLLEKPVAWLEGFGVNGGIVLLIFALLLIPFVYSLMIAESGMNVIVGFMLGTLPIWLPITTFLLFHEAWMQYVQLKFDMKQGRTTVEIKIPEEILKSPEAMELVLVQLHQAAAPDNHLQTYIDGKHPPTHGLELVSRGGDVRFYISTPQSKFKNILETQLYAQYPGIEVTELAVDYTAEIPWDPEKYAYFSIHFGLKKADAYPLKTYYEYGLHTMPKEEEKVDPISSMLEMLGSVGPGEYVWIQILIDANREVTFKEGAIGKKPDWKDDARKEIQNIIDKAKKRSDSAEVGGQALQLLTDTERQTIAAIERSLGKNAFNTAIRGMYIGTQEAFNPGERIGAIITGWRGYDDVNRNAIGVRWRTDFNWNWWQDPTGKKKQAWKKAELELYKLRKYQPFGGFNDGKQVDAKKVMTTEELATIFHIPGRVVTTPTLGRITSRRGEAPPNLPTGS